MEESKETTQEVAKPSKHSATVLKDRLLVVGDGFVCSVFHGGVASFKNGECLIGISFGDVPTDKIKREIHRQLKQDKINKEQADKMLTDHIKSARKLLVKAKQAEVEAKLTELNVPKEDADFVLKSLTAKVVESLLR